MYTACISRWASNAARHDFSIYVQRTFMGMSVEECAPHTVSGCYFVA